MLGGVCSGIANYFNIDPVIIRLIFIFFLFIEGSGLLAYLVAWVIIPMEPAEPGDVTIDIEKEEEDTTKKGNKGNHNNAHIHTDSNNVDNDENKTNNSDNSKKDKTELD